MENDNNHDCSHPFGRYISTMGKDFGEPYLKKRRLEIPSENPTILDFAQLALDVYDYKAAKQPNESKILSYYRQLVFSQDWDYENHRESEPRRGTYSTDYDPITGFYARVYENKCKDCAIIAIRGTSNKPDYEQDHKFSLNISIEQYQQAIDFVSRVKRKYNVKYITGHSLGGIVAKMIAPVTGLNVVTFNSSGVKHYLMRGEFQKNYDKWMNTPGNKNLSLGPVSNRFTSLLQSQKVLTYVVNNDEVGNFNIENDVGKHIFLSYGTMATKFNLQKIIESNIEGYDAVFKVISSIGVATFSAINYLELMPLHSMFKIYNFFHNNRSYSSSLESEYFKANI